MFKNLISIFLVMSAMFAVIYFVGEEEKGSRVVIFNKENFNKEVKEATKPVMVDFSAPWCAPCNRMTPVVERMASENEDYIIGKLNIDEASELAQEYSVNSIPAFLFFKDGEVKKRLSGIQSETDLLSALEGLKDE